MERPCAWKKYTPQQIEELEELCRGYKQFLSENKTERLCVKTGIKMAEEAGYVDLETVIAEGRELKAGDKVYAANHGKDLMLVNLGTAPLEQGFNILGAHVDSPRLDLKQNPAFEAGDMAYLDTHYYGGVKSYHWVASPLALVGVICKKDGTTVDINIGDKADDAVYATIAADRKRLSDEAWADVIEWFGLSHLRPADPPLERADVQARQGRRRRRDPRRDRGRPSRKI